MTQGKLLWIGTGLSLGFLAVQLGLALWGMQQLEGLQTARAQFQDMQAELEQVQRLRSTLGELTELRDRMRQAVLHVQAPPPRSSLWLDPQLSDVCPAGQYDVLHRVCTPPAVDAVPTLVALLAACACGQTCILRHGPYQLPSSPTVLGPCPVETPRIMTVYGEEVAEVDGRWILFAGNKLVNLGLWEPYPAICPALGASSNVCCTEPGPRVTCDGSPREE